MNTPGRTSKVGVIALVALLIAAAYYCGAFKHVSEPKVLARTLIELGVWGYVAFVLAYTMLQPFGVPGTVFIVAAPLIWPWPLAFSLSMIGTMGASVVGFAFARFVARDWVSARIPERFRKYEAALERNGLGTVVVLRLVLWMPQALHWFLGVSKVGSWTHFWGSLIGYTPPLLLVSYLGDEMFDASGAIRPDAWPILGALAVASIVSAVLAKIYARRRERGLRAA